MKRHKIEVLESSTSTWLFSTYTSAENFSRIVQNRALGLTGGEAGLLVTLGEVDVEIGDQGVDVVVPLDLQAEGCGEGQVLWLHRVDVHFLGEETRERFVAEMNLADLVRLKWHRGNLVSIARD